MNQTGLETSLEGQLQFFLHKDMSLDWPRAETDTHHILMGFDPDLSLFGGQGLDLWAAVAALALLVEPLQLAAALDVAVGQHLDQPHQLLGEILAITVEVLEEGVDGVGSLSRASISDEVNALGSFFQRRGRERFSAALTGRIFSFSANL